MAGEQNGFAAPAQGDNQIFHFSTADRVQTGGRLVQNEKIGIIQQCLRQSHAAAHAMRKFPDQTVARGIQSHHVEKLAAAVGDLSLAEIEYRAEVGQGFHGGQIFIEIRPFRQITHSRFHFDIAGTFAKNRDQTAGGIEMAENQFDQGRFAGAIRAQ